MVCYSIFLSGQYQNIGRVLLVTGSQILVVGIPVLASTSFPGSLNEVVLACAREEFVPAHQNQNGALVRKAKCDV